MFHDIRHRTKWVTVTLAILITTTAIIMAAVVSWERGGTTIERLLLLALSVAICIGTHLIPSLSKIGLAWLLWLGCLSCAIYSHVTFFTYASFHAGEVRAHSSGQVVALRQQIEADRNALTEIKSRPVTVVAFELGHATDYRLRSALRSELAESKRAASLRDDLVRLTGIVTSAEKTDSTDQVTSLLVEVTGSSEARVSLVIWSGIALLVELLGTLLWFEILCGTEKDSKIAPSLTSMSDPVADLRDAIAAGACKPTVSGIRIFLGCGQARAMTLRRAL